MLAGALVKYCIQNQNKPAKPRQLLDTLLKYDKSIDGKLIGPIIAGEPMLKQYINQEDGNK